MNRPCDDGDEPKRGQQAASAAVAADPRELARLQRLAEKDGRECVVGALVVVGGRVFVQRRRRHLALFPGCWDIVGGHVERGETLEGALCREVAEETGWRVVRIGPLVEVLDWEAEQAGRVRRKREFDFLVGVAGDLDQPRIEMDKFSDARWVDESELAELCRQDGGGMLGVAAAGLARARRPDDLRPQALTRPQM